MITCKKCNAQLEDGTRFCYICGTEVEPDKLCSSCGKPLDKASSFCQYCGTPVNITKTDQVPGNAPIQGAKPIPAPAPMNQGMPKPTGMPYNQPVMMNPAMPYNQPVMMNPAMPMSAGVPINQMNPGMPMNQKTKKKGKLLPKILIAAAALTVIVIAAVTAPRVFMKSKAVNAALYLKDGELNYSALSSIKPEEITNRLDQDGSMTDSFSYYLGYCITFSDDGKRLFYPDRVSDSEEGMAIYYQDLKKNAEGEKIDTEITQYKTNSAGTKIFYLKGAEDELYVSNLKEKEKIDSEVDSFYINADGSKLIYINSDGNIYEKDGKKDKLKLDSNSSIVDVSEDLKTIYYQKGTSLYVKKAGKDKEKLLSEVTSVINVYDTGEIYYLTQNDVTYNLSDFVNDDMQATDEAMVEPTEPLYPSYDDCKPDIEYPTEPGYYDYTDYWGYIDWDLYDSLYNEYYAAVDEYNAKWDEIYNAAVEEYNTAYEDYSNALNDYYAKQNRDSIRSSMEGVALPVTQYALYYYDAKESTKISDNYSNYLDYCSKKPEIIYQNYKKAEITKVNISEVATYDDLYNMASEAVYSATEVYAAVNAEKTAVKQTSRNTYYLKDDGDAIYYIDNYDEGTYTGDLYEIRIRDGKLEAPAKVDEEVYNVNLLYDDNTLVYYKNVKDDLGDLYLDKEMFDSEVYINSAYKKEGTDNLFYFVDFDTDALIGTLKMYDGKKKITIGDDINSYSVVNEDNLLYLKDYNIDLAKGDLYLYDGSDKRKEIDTDVTAIVHIYENGYRGDYSYLWEN